MINRSVVILRPAAPYIEWASSLSGPPFDEADQGDEVAYLIPGYDSEVEKYGVLADGWSVLFETELAAWHVDEDDWPQDRTFAMFQEWFEIELHSMVVDLCEGEIVDEEEE